MIPYHDENRTLRTPIVTLAILGLNVASWLLVQGAGTPAALARSVCDYGLIAGELTGMVPPGTEFSIGPDMICATDPGRSVLHLLTSMFLHGSWMHLIGNLWFLWIFGNNLRRSFPLPHMNGRARSSPGSYAKPERSLPTARRPVSLFCTSFPAPALTAPSGTKSQFHSYCRWN